MTSTRLAMCHSLSARPLDAQMLLIWQLSEPLQRHGNPLRVVLPVKRLCCLCGVGWLTAAASHPRRVLERSYIALGAASLRALWEEVEVRAHPTRDLPVGWLPQRDLSCTRGLFSFNMTIEAGSDHTPSSCFHFVLVLRAATSQLRQLPAYCVCSAGANYLSSAQVLGTGY